MVHLLSCELRVGIKQMCAAQDIGQAMGSPGKSPAKSTYSSTPAKHASAQADSSTDDEDGRCAGARKNSECSHAACSAKVTSSCL